MYFFINPLIFWFIFKKTGADGAKYLETVSIYGYSMTSLLILEVCYIVPLLLFKIIATIACGAISLYFLNDLICSG